MTWEKFWSIIDLIRAKADMQDEASVKQFLYTELINLPQDELLGFDCAWQSYRNKANFPKMVAAACMDDFLPAEAAEMKPTIQRIRRPK